MATKSNHPFVFVHGMMGWGEDKKLYKVLPYWGMMTGSYLKKMRKNGYEVYAPAVSPLGSAWDRACELYAQLTGTTVDYGKAHAEKYGHDRYGMTHTKPFIDNWTPERSIHLLGHSFGGPTMRMFYELLEYGSAEERAATPENELSPLFKGGQGNLVKSITAIAGPFDGITFPHALPFTVDGILTYVLPTVASIIGNVGTGHVYDFQMGYWGITDIEDGERSIKNALNFKAIRKWAKAKDNVFADIHIDRAAEINANTHIPDAYLFAVTGNGTKKGDDGNWHRDSIMFPLFTPFAYSLGKFPDQTISGIEINESWRMNDGIVPVESGLHPKTQPWVDFDEVKNAPIKKGVWHALPLAWGDHGTVIGGSVSFIGKGAGKFNGAYGYWMDFLDKLPD